MGDMMDLGNGMLTGVVDCYPVPYRYKVRPLRQLSHRRPGGDFQAGRIINEAPWIGGQD